jgi:hypothetical protein
MKQDDLDNFTADDSKKWGIIALLIGLPVYIISQRYLSANSASLGNYPFNKPESIY